MSAQEVDGRRPGKWRREAVTGSWVYEVTPDDEDGPTLTLRCSEPAGEDESGLYRTFCLSEGGNIVVAAENHFRLIEGPDRAVTRNAD